MKERSASLAIREHKSKPSENLSWKAYRDFRGKNKLETDYLAQFWSRDSTPGYLLKGHQIDTSQRYLRIDIYAQISQELSRK